jgi:hypothetical protein
VRRRRRTTRFARTPGAAERIVVVAREVAAEEVAV